MHESYKIVHLKTILLVIMEAVFHHITCLNPALQVFPDKPAAGKELLPENLAD